MNKYYFNYSNSFAPIEKAIGIKKNRCCQYIATVLVKTTATKRVEKKLANRTSAELRKWKWQIQSII